MANKLKVPTFRAIVRTIIGLICAMWSPYWIEVAFPAALAWYNTPGNEILGLSLLVVLFFSIIAATVRWVRVGNIELRLVAAAKQYASGAITLDEYGLQSKQILGKYICAPITDSTAQ